MLFSNRKVRERPEAAVGGRERQLSKVFTEAGQRSVNSRIYLKSLLPQSNCSQSALLVRLLFFGIMRARLEFIN